MTSLKEVAFSPSGRKAIKYTLVSVISVAVSQVVLAFAFGLLHWTARSSNILAVSVGAVPSYYLNRNWAWGKSGPSHLMKEVLPFWGLALLGLVFSTWSADFAETFAREQTSSRATQTMMVNAAALGAFGVLWVGKFVFFNKVLFKTHPEELADAPALDGRTGIPT